jgi:hypothetical protein
MMEREELLTILSTYLDLQPTYRQDEFKTLCPFHPETRPSCYINIEKLIFHCFGCGKSGTVASMLKDLGIEFQTVAAEQAVTSILDVLTAAQEFFRAQIDSHPHARIARDFLRQKKRERFKELFGLGYAPSEPRALLDALKSFPQELLKQSGLFSDALSPLLRNRITIPLRNSHGKIIAFAGRALSDDQPKFINTRNTSLFQKRAYLAFTYEASQLLNKSKLLYVVEGYFDAMHFLINEIPAVCVMSNNLTLAQVTILKRLHAQHRKFNRDAKIVLLFDSDSAGIEALATNIAMLSTLLPSESLRVQFAPADKDPDEVDVEMFRSYYTKHEVVPGFVAAVCRAKPSPEKVARSLLVFPDEMRREISRLLERRRPILGSAYLQLVFQFLGSFLRKSVRKPSRPTHFDLFSIAAAAVIQSKLSVEQLGELLNDFPESLRKLLTTPLESLSKTEQEQYAKLAFMPCPLAPDEILRALLKVSAKRRLLKILERAESCNDNELNALSSEFEQALSEFNSLTDQSF